MDPLLPSFTNKQLAALMEKVWTQHRADFFADMVSILTDKLAQSIGGASASKSILQVVERAITPPDADWHPFDLIVQSWKAESLIRHAIDLYSVAELDAPPEVHAQNSHTFYTQLIEMAADACLKSRVDSHDAKDLAAWIGKVGRCNNFSLALLNICEELVEEVEAGSMECPTFAKLKVCRDLASNLVEPHGIGHDILTQMCSGATTVNELPARLHELQELGLEEAQISAIECFKYTLIGRQLQGDDMSVAAGFESVRRCLDGGNSWEEGKVPPAVATALTAALDRLGLLAYELERFLVEDANDPLFGELDAVLSTAIGANHNTDNAPALALASDAASGWQAGLVCSILQTHYAQQISDCIYEDMEQFEACCRSFQEAVGKLGPKLEAGAASAICHIAYAKAFVQVVSHDVHGAVMVIREAASPFETAAMQVIREALCGPHGANPVYDNLRVYLLKELRR